MLSLVPSRGYELEVLNLITELNLLRFLTRPWVGAPDTRRSYGENQLENSILLRILFARLFQDES